MPGQQHDLHGSARIIPPIALLLIDVINDLALRTAKRCSNRPSPWPQSSRP